MAKRNDMIVNVLIAMLVAYSCYYIYTQYYSHGEFMEEQLAGVAEEVVEAAGVAEEAIVAPVAPKKSNVPSAYDTEASTNLTLTKPQEANIPLPECAQNKAFVSTNLLPKDAPKQDNFAEFSPAGGNFVDSSKFIIGAVSQTTRNANLQLRSEPANPRTKASPWLQSTILPEDSRRSMEIGN